MTKSIILFPLIGPVCEVIVNGKETAYVVSIIGKNDYLFGKWNPDERLILAPRERFGSKEELIDHLVKFFSDKETRNRLKAEYHAFPDCFQLTLDGQHVEHYIQATEYVAQLGKVTIGRAKTPEDCLDIVFKELTK